MMRTLPKLAEHRLPRLLWASGIAAIVVFLLLLALLLGHLRKTELDNAARELTSLAKAVTGMVERYLDTHALAMNAAAHWVEGHQDYAGRSLVTLPELRAGAPALHDMYVLDANGRRLGQPAGAPMLDAATLAQRQALLDAGRPIIEAPHLDGSGHWLMRLIQPVADARTGWLVGELDLEAMDALLANIDVGADGTVVIIHEAGRLVARQRESARYRDADLSSLSVFNAQADVPSDVALQKGALDGVVRMIAYERLPEARMVVAVGRSQERILAGWWRLAWASLIAFLLVAVFLMLAISAIRRAWTTALRATNEVGIEQERLSEVQEIAGLGFWEHETESDRLMCSEEVERLLELDPAGIRTGYGALLDRVSADERVEIELQLRHAAINDVPVDIPMHIVRHHGRVRHLRLRARPRVDRRGVQVLTGTLLDVTDVTEAQERLALAEAQYRYLFELSPVPLWVFDLESERFVAVNQATVELYGWSPLQFLDMSLADLGEPDPVQQSIRTLADSSLENGLIWRHVTSDNRVVHVRVYSTPVSFEGREARLVASLDFTDKVRAEAELADSEARFRLVARVSNDAIYDFDSQHRSLWWSDSYYHHFGADPVLDDSDFNTWAQRIHEDEREQVLAGFQAALDSDSDDWEARYRYRRRDGGYAHVQDRGYVLRDDTGKALRMVGGMLDRSGELLAQQALAERESSYRGLIDRLPLPLLVLRGNEVAFANPSASAALQDEPGRPLVGRRLQGIFDPAVVTALHEPDWQATRRQVRVYTPDGGHFLAEVSVSNYRDSNGDGLQVILRDLAEQLRFEQILTHQAQHDELTGLPNRRALKERLRSGLVTANEQGRELAVIFIDLDQFKLINDALGHAVGDNVICSVAERLQASIGPGTALGRFGGDEFMLIADADAADGLIRDVQEIVAQPIEVMGVTQFLTVSVGVAVAPRDGADADTLIRSADAAMYEAKRLGRNRSAMFSNALHRTASNRLELVSRLRQADLSKELALYYQTQHHAASGKVSGAEMLLRWPNGPSTLRQPGRFIPICEETGLMVPIGRWVMREACRRQAELSTLVGTPCRVAVNVSAQQFMHDDVVAEVASVLEESGVDGRLLELEITESVILADPGRVVRTIESLRALGVEVSIDDFGSGYSNLGYLSRLPVTRLKIDRSFVRDVLEDRQQEAICASIISLAHSLSLRVVAEGVETEAQREWLVAHDCDEVQGYLFSHPRPFPDAVPESVS